jgi:hypothetical protein
MSDAHIPNRALPGGRGVNSAPYAGPPRVRRTTARTRLRSCSDSDTTSHVRPWRPVNEAAQAILVKQRWVWHWPCLEGKGNQIRTPTGSAHAQHSQRIRLRAPRPEKEARLRHHGDRHPGTRHRCEHRDFQCRQRGAAEAPSVRRSREARARLGRHARSQRNGLPVLRIGLQGSARARDDVLRHRRIQHRPRRDERRSVEAGPGEGGVHYLEPVLGAGRAAGAGPPIRRG